MRKRSAIAVSALLIAGLSATSIPASASTNDIFWGLMSGTVIKNVDLLDPSNDSIADPATELLAGSTIKLDFEVAQGASITDYTYEWWEGDANCSSSQFSRLSNNMVPIGDTVPADGEVVIPSTGDATGFTAGEHPIRVQIGLNGALGFSKTWIIGQNNYCQPDPATVDSVTPIMNGLEVQFSLPADISAVSGFSPQFSIFPYDAAEPFPTFFPLPGSPEISCDSSYKCTLTDSTLFADTDKQFDFFQNTRWVNSSTSEQIFGPFSIENASVSAAGPPTIVTQPTLSLNGSQLLSLTGFGQLEAVT